VDTDAFLAKRFRDGREHANEFIAIGGEGNESFFFDVVGVAQSHWKSFTIRIANA